MAASLRAAATRMLRPAVLPGEGRRLLVHTQQVSYPARSVARRLIVALITLGWRSSLLLSKLISQGCTGGIRLDSFPLIDD